jgi:hypothetical protein
MCIIFYHGKKLLEKNIPIICHWIPCRRPYLLKRMKNIKQVWFIYY